MRRPRPSHSRPFYKQCPDNHADEMKERFFQDEPADLNGHRRFRSFAAFGYLVLRGSRKHVAWVGSAALAMVLRPLRGGQRAAPASAGGGGGPVGSVPSLILIVFRPMTTNHGVAGPLLLLLSLLLIGASLLSVGPPVASTASTAPADTVDTKPLRLLMVGLAQDMARINTGIWHEDYDLIREGASSIANHPKIPPDQIATIRKTLDAEFQNFVRYDKAVHNTATELVSAAEARNWSDVLSAQTQLRDGCVGCHTAYRERLRPVLGPSN